MSLPHLMLATVAAAIAALCAPASQASLIHRWSFDEPAGAAASGASVADSVGAAHGTVRGTGAQFTGAGLDLPGGASGSAAYVDLPNGLVSGLVAVTFEAWVTIDTTGHSWARIFDFGSTDGAEITGPGGSGGGRDYIFLSAAEGSSYNTQRLEVNDAGTNFTSDTGTATAAGQTVHLVVSWEDTGAGTSTLNYWRDGVQKTANFAVPRTISAINDVNNWLGRSNYTGDANLDGTFAEFRIYDHAFDAQEVASSAAAGPDAAVGAPHITSFTAAPSAILEGETVTVSWSSPDATSIVLDGSPVATPSGSVQMTPLVGATYTLGATNANGTSTATASVTVDPGVPVADDAATSTAQDVAKAITVTASDPNNYPSPLSYLLVGGPSNGTLTGSLPNVTYQPAAGFYGADSFTFKVNDGNHDSDVATVEISVIAPPSPPADILLTTNTVPSTTGPGSLVAIITTDDPNPSDTHSYILAPGAGDDDNARFSISGNQLLAAHDFALEAGNSFSIRLRSTDSTGRQFEKTFTANAVEVSDAVVINEIHYDPPDGSTPGEFIELYNPGASAVNLSGWTLDDGVQYTFPANTSIAGGGFLVIAQDPATAFSLYGVNALGPWVGKLDGDGERVALRDGGGSLIDEVDYGVGFPWPVAPAGDGGSMELLHPGLDNDLGGSWRASLAPPDLAEATLLPLGSTTWRWRPGDTEASSPVGEWRLTSFVEDGSWANAQTPIGYGSVNGVTLNTTISGMQSNYNCIFLRNTFTVLPGELPPSLQLRSTSDDGVIVWINGVEVERRRFTGEPTVGDLASTQQSEGVYESVTRTDTASFLVEGENTITVQVFNSTQGSSDLGFDLEVIRPEAIGRPEAPTPGFANSVSTTQVPPQVRQVAHLPKEPQDTDPVTITAKVTDPEGVASVELIYQVVLPGQFIPSRTPRTVGQILAAPEDDSPLNPAFEDPANWTTVAMRDDGAGGDAVAGDSIFTAALPQRAHRTLVRYRIRVEDLGGTSARVPYPDDRSLNFAYFVYNGVPDYVASTRSVHPDGAGHVWSKETLTSVPVYHWLIRPQDMLTLQAYNGSEQFTNNGTDAELAARRAYDWEGAMVYDGVVYDHVRARLRGGNSRYGDFDGRFPRGKRHYKFRFNKGHYFAARDEKGDLYERKWRVFNVSRMFGTTGGNSWGLPEEIGDRLYHTMGVPTQRAHWFHFRVVDDADEAPDQYHGDFWGIMQVQERYDVRFLESRDMTKGNLYKLSDFMFDAERQRRYQALGMVSDGSEFDNIRDNLHGGQTATWLNEHVNYERWYGYSAVGEAIRHYDIFPEPTGRHRLKNLVWYFEPVGTDPTRGVCWHLPYDYDASWGPNFNNGWDHANNGLYGHVAIGGNPYIDKPDMKIAHRNVLRSFRDLVWQPDQIEGLLDDRAAVIAELSEADRDRWRLAPATAGTANDDPLAFKLQDMKNFAFTGWSGGSGPSVPGGRDAFLDSIADGPDSGLLPATPTISYTGAVNYPTDGLQFQSSAFSDPQGAGTFAAMEWRIGEIEDPTAPAWDPADDFILENDLIWGSGELATFGATLSIPGTALKVGRTYRARVRHKDSSGRWGHWSSPAQFTTTVPTVLDTLKANLMITEIMYHPGDRSAAEIAAGFSESDFEYLELHNISNTLTLDLGDVRFTKGADFDFVTGTITSLPPGGYALVVRNAAAFQMRYGSGLPVAGVWEAGQNLSNGGEQLKLSHGSGTAIHDFVYDDDAPWPTAADGSGVSLVLADPDSAPDHSLAASWRTSYAPYGTPGRGEASSPLAQWLGDHGVSDPLEEDFAPGISNLLVFALGADLLANPADAIPSATFVTSGATQHLAIQFRRRLIASDLSYTVETSTDLTGWASDPGDGSLTSVVSAVDNGDGTETVTVRLSAPWTGNGRHFLRLTAGQLP